MNLNILKKKEAVKKGISISDNNSAVTITKRSELDGVYITGSVKSTNGFDYILNRHDRSFYAAELGYKVRWVSSCHAILIKKGVSHDVYCDDRLPEQLPQLKIEEFQDIQSPTTEII